jgi:periplasmic divalent cation tolerance protein
MAYLTFYVTHPDEATARRVAGELLERRLIACANVFPVTSAYWWQGAVQQEGEWASLLKTRPALETAVEAVILELHPYEVPCVMRMEVRANAQFEAWILGNTREEK